MLRIIFPVSAILGFAFLGLGTPALAAGVSGQLKVFAEQYPYSLYEPVDNLIPTLQGHLEGKAKWSKSIRVQWKLLVNSNLVSDGDVKLYPGQVEKLYANLPEAYVEKKWRGQKFRAGFNTVNWGIVDLYSPMDSVNTTAFFHPLRSIKQGAPMVQWLFSGNWLDADFVYIPWQTRALLPDSDSRWLPREFLVNVQARTGKIFLPSKIQYEFQKPESIDSALYNNYGAKLTAHLGRLDIHAQFYEGAGTTSKAISTITLDSSVVSNDLYAESPIKLAPLAYRMRTSALGIVYATDTWIFKNENVYQAGVGDSPLVTDWAWQHVIGAETNWDVFGGPLTTIFQFYYSTNPTAADNLIANYFRLFDRTPVVALRFSASDQLTLIGSALYETKTQGLFFIAGFEQKLKDALSWGLSWRDFSAKEDGLLKTFDKNDHLNLEMSYYF